MFWERAQYLPVASVSGSPVTWAPQAAARAACAPPHTRSWKNLQVNVSIVGFPLSRLGATVTLFCTVSFIFLALTFHFSNEGLEPSASPGHAPAPYFTPIQSEGREKVDILELLHKAKIDLKPLLSTLTVNKARLRESSKCLLTQNSLSLTLNLLLLQIFYN